MSNCTNLLLSFEVGGILHIGPVIEVKIVKIKGKIVTLRISAPRGVAVHRHEVFVEVCGRGPLIRMEEDRRYEDCNKNTREIPAASQPPEYRNIQDFADEALAEQEAEGDDR